MTLREWMRRNQVSNGQMAKLAGITVDHGRYAIGHMKNGTRLPTLRRAWAIFQATGGQVGLEDWFKRGPR
jgi:hypothetical protein